MRVHFWSENVKGRSYLNDLNLNGWLIVEWNLEKWCAAVWTGLIWLWWWTCWAGCCKGSNELPGFKFLGSFWLLNSRYLRGGLSFVYLSALYAALIFTRCTRMFPVIQPITYCFSNTCSNAELSGVKINSLILIFNFYSVYVWRFRNPFKTDICINWI
jgi:hypothetical protein